jgi:hypothetical protein
MYCCTAVSRCLVVGERDTARDVFAETRIYNRAELFYERLTGSLEVSSSIELRLH